MHTPPPKPLNLIFVDHLALPAVDLRVEAEVEEVAMEAVDLVEVVQAGKD